MRRLQILFGLAVGAFFCTPAASGALRLTLSAGGRTVAIDDGSALDAAKAAGTVSFFGAIEGWKLHMSVATVGRELLLELNNAESGQGNMAALSIGLSADNFMGGSGLAFASRISGTLGTGHNMTYQGYYNPSNIVGATENAIGALLDFNPGATLAGNRVAGTGPPAAYSLSQAVVITANGKGKSSALAGIFDAEVVSADPSVAATPEPASIMLLGVVALFVAYRLFKLVQASKSV